MVKVVSSKANEMEQSGGFYLCPHYVITISVTKLYYLCKVLLIMVPNESYYF